MDIAIRPYVLLSCAMSVDGYIDDAAPRRLLLSNEEDFDRVDGERAASDAILVGANTIRVDNPRLLVRSEARRAERIARGQPLSPVKVTITRTGNLDPERLFFTAGNVEKLVYCPPGVASRLSERVGFRATVIAVVDLDALLADLASRGVRRLMVEGGSSIITQFLTSGHADELQLVVAPFFVGDTRAPRFVGDGTFPHDADHQMRLAEVRRLGDVVLLRYLLT